MLLSPGGKKKAQQEQVEGGNVAGALEKRRIQGKLEKVVVLLTKKVKGIQTAG